MKPLGFTLEEMGEVLHLRAQVTRADLDPAVAAALRERLSIYLAAAHARVEALREQLTTAEGFATDLHEHLGRLDERPHVPHCP